MITDRNIYRTLHFAKHGIARLLGQVGCTCVQSGNFELLLGCCPDTRLITCRIKLLQRGTFSVVMLSRDMKGGMPVQVAVPAASFMKNTEACA